MLLSEKERMLTVSTAPAPQTGAPAVGEDDDLMQRLHSLRSMEPLLGKSDVKRLTATREISQIEPEPLLDVLAGFQTVIRQSNVQTLNSTYAVTQAMRDCKQLSESVEKRITQSNAGLHKLQADLGDVPRLERSVDQIHRSAAKCAEMLDSIHSLLAQADMEGGAVPVSQ